MIEGQHSLSAGERNLQLSYLSGNAWRYAATLRHVRKVCGRSLAGLSVLDVGAYPGHLAGFLSHYEGASVTAITLVSNPAFEAWMGELGVRMALCNVERDSLPAPDKSIDVVLCCELIEHLDGDVQHLLREVRRVLSKTGVFVLTTPNHAALAWR
jgi:2-polyprenyl-3-methyl-5-hydroxy-6-metoxy-1,4-benzoquinol methylase